MKKLIVILISILILTGTGSAWADDIVFNWNQEISADFAGWKLYQGVAVGGPYLHVTDIQYSGTPEDAYQIDIPLPVVVGDPVDYFFVLTAFDTQGNESVYSNEVKYTATDTTAPGIPQTLTVTIKQE